MSATPSSGVVRIFRLTNESGGLGLSCTPAGVSLAGVPLLRSTRAGFVPRPARRYGYKTKRDVYKNLDWCLAKISDGKISIRPHRHEKLDSWRSLPPDRIIVIPATDGAAAAGAALRLALDRCE